VERNKEQSYFRKHLLHHYFAQPFDAQEQIWCPISKHLGPTCARSVAQIVPWKLGYETIGDLFAGDGREILWSMENGLIISYKFQYAFDRLEFCFLPVVKPGEEDGWKLFLIDEGLRGHDINGGMLWDVSTNFLKM
jgi:hypothetical protein